MKVRGQSVETAEVEAALLANPAVREAAVVGRPDRWGETRLVAYVVGEASPAALRSQLGRMLPASMVPSAFVRVDSLPLTSNGKIDRDALPDPEPMRSGAHPPRDRLELCLAAIWEDVLKLRPVGIRDDFFELGGDSILALELVSQVESVCGRRLPISLLLEAPTVARQAEILRDASWSPAWPAIVALQPHGDRPGFFCAAGAGTDVLSLVELPRHLGPDQPFYGLQPPGQDGQRAPLGAVDSLAAYFVREMRAVQPRGPYFLGGSSYGGIVAFEMAQQLVRAGEEVGLLALFDTRAPGYPTAPPRRAGAISSVPPARQPFSAAAGAPMVRDAPRDVQALGAAPEYPLAQARRPRALPGKPLLLLSHRGLRSQAPLSPAPLSAPDHVIPGARATVERDLRDRPVARMG